MFLRLINWAFPVRTSELVNQGMRFDGMVAAGGWGRRVLFCVGLALATGSLSLLAQTRQQTPVSQSELARQNMERVAAPVGQLVNILHRDPGLMVELKRWIATDATDHGQVISDPDLADEAIFERLETDTTFRGVATLLVRKYGYLQPLVNPDSPLAREQE